MEKTAEDDICSSSLCFFKPSVLLCVAILVPYLVSTCFFSSGFSPFLGTFLVLVLSTLFLFTFTKKRSLIENTVQDEDLNSGQENLPEMEVEGKLQTGNETATHKNAAQQGEVGQIHDYMVGLPDFQSDSESDNDSITSEDFELNWKCPDNLGQSPESSDGSDSDDDNSLIEIALPGRQSNLKEEPKQKLQPILPDFLPESIFQQQGLAELLAEMNEEENLIEIDISMGSIKCSSFEIEA